MERMMLRISFAVAMIGLIGLFLMGQAYDIGSPSPGSGIVSMTGKVASVRTSGNATFITLSVVDSVDVTAFGDVNISAGDEVDVVGEKDGDGVDASRIRIVG
jgi:hypothetical protein